jgi:serine/threonine protein kinase
MNLVLIKADISSLAIIMIEFRVGFKELFKVFSENDSPEKLSTIYVNKAKESKVRIQLLDLLTKMLKYDQKERLNAIQVCNHEWIKEEIKLQTNNTLKEVVTKCNIDKKTTDVKEDKNILSNSDNVQSVDSDSGQSTDLSQDSLQDSIVVEDH